MAVTGSVPLATWLRAGGLGIQQRRVGDCDQLRELLAVDRVDGDTDRRGEVIAADLLGNRRRDRA
jgi:hypothetical protein